MSSKIVKESPSSGKGSILAKRLARVRGPKIPGFIYTAARSPAGARRGADGVGRQCVGQPAWCGAVVQQSKNESLYDARKANEPNRSLAGGSEHEEGPREFSATFVSANLA